MTPSTYQPLRPGSPSRCRGTFPSDPAHHPEEDLAFIQETALNIADCYVSLEIARDHREILVGRVADALVRNGAICIKQDPDSGPNSDWQISWDDSAIARSLGCQQGAPLEDDSRRRLGRWP